jgi:hypothetical protein
MRVEFLTAVRIQITGVLDVKPCILVDTNVPEVPVASIFKLEATQMIVTIY